jgi:DNA recombination protein RmuC
MLSVTDFLLIAAIVLAATAFPVVLMLRKLRAEDHSAKLAEQLAASEKRLADEMTRLRESFERALRESVEAQGRVQLDATQRLMSQIRESLETMRRDNEAKLEKIRATVEEKLQTTLENRFGESFKLVSERLELVHKGLGEMQSLASGVGDLKRVLTNVRSRGTFGEVQLAALLEQVLTPAQYECNCVTIPGSSERVEFAIRLPGRDEDDGIVRLPIDAKFPQEDYLRLQDAYDAGDQTALDAARKALRARLLSEAATIRMKYVSPPHTTDFALLFVPTEGLYAEILRMGGVAEAMQTDHHVVLTGPTTLYAVLSSLQMGFRTLAIEKRSSEVWKILAAVKTEFGKFGESLSLVSKKLQEASHKIEDSARRSRAVERTLRDVEALPENDAALLIGGTDGSDSHSV